MNYLSNFSAYYFTHNFIMVILVFISIFTFFILFKSFYGLKSYGSYAGASILEYMWTIIPLFIVFILLIPLFFDYKVFNEIDQNVFCVANQWYWDSDESSNLFNFLPTLLNSHFSEALIFSFLTGSTICFNLTSNDVLHSFGLNSLYTKVDCVPGVLHSLYVDFFYSGIYIVYCTELCGVNHSVMPLFIVIN
uniref:Cytochrome c oxidase subunit 2 n=1 Tax=Coeloplana loyai TaxID=1742921 RepID=A0A2R4ZL99_9METZ|nr:cytochrome c oxidase subunit II [Coeloplana loyai]